MIFDELFHFDLWFNHLKTILFLSLSLCLRLCLHFWSLFSHSRWSEKRKSSTQCCSGRDIHGYRFYLHKEIGNNYVMLTDLIKILSTPIPNSNWCERRINFRDENDVSIETWTKSIINMMTMESTSCCCCYWHQHFHSRSTSVQREIGKSCGDDEWSLYTWTSERIWNSNAHGLAIMCRQTMKP